MHRFETGTSEERRNVLDKETFSKLAIDSTDSLYRVSKSILGNDSDCEDAVGEAITIAFQKLDTLKKDEYAKTWLTRILIHECFRICRQRKRIVLVADNDESAPGKQNGTEIGYYTASEHYFDLYQAMEQLTGEQKLTIILFYYEGYSVREIARMTDVTQGTVKSRLGRARSQLKRFLKEEEHYV